MRRWLEAQDLLDRVRKELPVIHQLPSLVGVLAEHLADPADEAVRRFVARGREDVDEDQDLLPGEVANLTRGVLELDAQQVGHEVVGGVIGSPGDVVGEEGLVGKVVVVVLARFPGQLLHAEVLALAHGLLIALGDAEQHSDHVDRHDVAEVEHEVEAVLTDERIERIRAEVADLALQRVHLARGEHAGEHAAVRAVQGRVLEDEHTRRDVDVRLDELEDPALRRAVGAVVDEAPVDVLEATHGVEVELFVVVERRLFAQPAIDRVRIGVRLRIGRVVVEIAARRQAHGADDTQSVRRHPRSDARAGRVAAR